MSLNHPSVPQSLATIDIIATQEFDVVTAFLLRDVLPSLGCSAVVPHYQNTGATVVDSVMESTTSTRVQSSNPEACLPRGVKSGPKPCRTEINGRNVRVPRIWSTDRVWNEERPKEHDSRQNDPNHTLGVLAPGSRRPESTLLAFPLTS